MIKSIFNRFLLAVSLLVMCSCSCYNYSNWKKVEIPTDTPVRGTIKIPNEWEFISEDGIITLMDQVNDKIIAEQVYQEWEFTGWYGHTRVNTWDNMEFRTNIKDMDYKNIDNYEPVKINSSAALVYKFNDGKNERLCVFIYVYLDLSNPACDPETGMKYGDFNLCLMFDELVELDIIQQMAVSYLWGGTINDPKK